MSRPSNKCERCQKFHYSGSSRLACKRRILRNQTSPQPATPKQDHHLSGTGEEELQKELNKLQTDIDACRRKYFGDYNQYRRQGLGEGEYCHEKTSEKMDQVRVEKSHHEDIAAIFEDLIALRDQDQDQEQKNRNKRRPDKTQQLKYYLEEHSAKILTFEEMLLKEKLTAGMWDWEDQVELIRGKDWMASDTRSRLRQIRGRDSQSTKIKYAVAWKILTDPLTRIMLSDRFMETWHSRTFPKLVNPYRFRRMKNELAQEKAYHTQENFQLANERHQDLLKRFEQLSQEVIELSCNPLPPSLKKQTHQTIKKKKDLKNKIEEELLEMEEEAESPFLVILPPISKPSPEPSPYVMRYDYYDRNLQSIKSQKETVKEKKEKAWLRGLPTTEKAFCLAKFGDICGPSIAIAKAEGIDALPVLQLDHSIRKLKNNLRTSDYHLNDVYQFEASHPPTYQHRQAVKNKLLDKKEEEDRVRREPNPAGRAMLVGAARRALHKIKPIVKYRYKENFIAWKYVRPYRDPPLPPKQSPGGRQTEEPASPKELIPQEAQQEQKEEKLKERAAKRKCLQEFSESRVHIIKSEPNCPNCTKELQGRLMWDQGKIICTTCPYQQPNSSFTPIMRNSVLKVRTTGPFMLPVLLPPFQNHPNNVKEKMKNSWNSQNAYLSSCPDYGECGFTDFSSIEKELDTFRLNMESLPLTVQPSTIPQAGQGLFATRDIKADTLVGIYSGLVGTHLDSNSNSNSIFELGWFRRQGFWVPLVVDGLVGNDGSRFVNSLPPEKTNVKAIIGVYRQELTILYLTKRSVAAGEELYVYYGKNYPLPF